MPEVTSKVEGLYVDLHGTPDVEYIPKRYCHIEQLGAKWVQVCASKDRVWVKDLVIIAYN